MVFIPVKCLFKSSSFGFNCCGIPLNYLCSLNYLELAKLLLEVCCRSSVVANVVYPSTLEITKYSDQVRIRLIVQLFKGISNFLHILPKYFNEADISILLVPAALVLLVICDLSNLNDCESAIVLFGKVLSLQYCHNRQVFLNNYHSILKDCTSAPLNQYLWHNVRVNEAQF